MVEGSGGISKGCVYNVLLTSVAPCAERQTPHTHFWSILQIFNTETNFNTVNIYRPRNRFFLYASYSKAPCLEALNTHCPEVFLA